MRFDADDDDEIARGAALRGRLPVTALADVRARVRTRGNIHFDVRFTAHIPPSLAVGALVSDDLSPAAAVGARPHADGAAEHGILRETHLPLAAAARTGAHGGAALGARSVAGRAGFVAGIVDFLGATLCSVHKAQREGELDIFARRIALNGGTSAETLEDAVEDVAEAREARKAARAAHAAHAGMRLLVVVRSAFLLVGEHLVRLVDLLEFFRGELIPGVKIGVVLLDELFVRRLDLLFRGVLAHAEDFIIISLLCHNCYLNPRRGEAAVDFCFGEPPS